MEGAWETLRRAGVPDGPLRPLASGPVDWDAVAAAVAEVVAEGVTQAAARDALVAWLGALRSHWPSRAGALLARVPTEGVEALAAGSPDPNRYLKLRRIALAHLSRIA
jgi:hypothetical protein